MDIQTILDVMSDANRRTRSKYHLTLGALIAALECASEKYVSVDAGGTVGTLGSYRGHYSDLAFDPIDGLRPVADVLADCRTSLHKKFQGYKGGDFLMEADTPLWISAYGDASGVAVVGIKKDGNKIVLETKETNS